MRFTFAILLSAVAQTIVSALPISDVQSDIDARDEFDVAPIRREYDAPIFKRVSKPYQVALHRSDIGSSSEHWALHIHPTGEGVKDNKWHIMHAVSDKANKDPKGALAVEQKNEKGYTHGRPVKPTSQHHVIGEFKSHADAERAMESFHNVKLHQPYPKENCVDWTKKAVDHMVSNNLMTSHSNGVQGFHNIHDTNKDTVRATTATKANKKEAGSKRR